MTEHGLKQQLKRLEGAYKPPSGDGEQILATWMDVLADVNDQELAEAVTRYMRGTSPYHPRPGQLRGMVLDARPEEKQERNGNLLDEHMACTVCGATPQLLFPDGQPVPESWQSPPMPPGLTASQMMAWGEQHPPHPQLLEQMARGWCPRYYYRHNRLAHEQAGAPMFGLPPYWRPRA